MIEAGTASLIDVSQRHNSLSLFTRGPSSPRGSLYRLLTVTGGLIFVEPEGEVAHHVGKRAETDLPITVYVPRQRPDIAFLISDGCAMTMRSDDGKATALSYIIGGEPGRLTLRHPIRQSFVCAPALEYGQLSHLSCHGDKVGDWEVYHFESILPDQAPVYAKAAALVLDDLFCREVTARRLAGWMRTQHDVGKSGLVAAALRVMPIDLLHEFAALVVPSSEMSATLLSSLAGDWWAETIIPALLAWCDDRQSISTLNLGTSYDFLAQDYAARRGVVSAGSLFNSLMRTKVEPRYDLAVLASARNEGVYLLEWIAHHRAIGVQHFFIYSNYNNDGSDELLSVLAQNGVITWVRNEYGPGVLNLVKSYAHCLSCLPQSLDYRWTLIIDLDEFLILNKAKYRTLVDLANQHEETGATTISFSWKMYTIGGQNRWTGEPLIKRNLYSSGETNKEVKTMCRTRHFLLSWPHDPTPVPGTKLSYQNAAGELHHWPGRQVGLAHGEPNYDHAWVNHYYFKSLDECMWKMARKRDDDHIHQDFAISLPTVLGQVEAIDQSTAHSDNSALAHLEGLSRQLAELRAMPGVVEAEAVVKVTFNERLEELRRQVRADFEAALQSADDLSMRNRIESALSVLNQSYQGPSGKPA